MKQSDAMTIEMITITILRVWWYKYFSLTCQIKTKKRPLDANLKQNKTRTKNNL